VNRKRVLLVIDFFNPDGFRETPRFAKAALAAARRTARLKQALRKRRGSDDLRERQLRPLAVGVRRARRAVPRAPGGRRRDRDAARTEAGDWSVLKPRHSAFYGTPLQFMLDELGARRSS
jgi:hypothetical protein